MYVILAVIISVVRKSTLKHYTIKVCLKLKSPNYVGRDLSLSIGIWLACDGVSHVRLCFLLVKFTSITIIIAYTF